MVIPKIEQLHRAIALAVVSKRPRLTAHEVRFLRKYLGWSGADFAKHMGVTPESVSRWENEREQMSPVADRLLRLMVVTRAPVSEYPLDSLAELEVATSRASSKTSGSDESPVPHDGSQRVRCVGARRTRDRSRWPAEGRLGPYDPAAVVNRLTRADERLLARKPPPLKVLVTVTIEPHYGVA